MLERQNSEARQSPSQTQSADKIAERRAQKIESLLNGKTTYGDDIFSELQISKTQDQDGTTYSIRLAKGGDTLANYQLYHPPRHGRLEDKLYGEKNWEGGRLAALNSQTMGQHLESIIDGKLAAIYERPLSESGHIGLVGVAFTGSRMILNGFQEVVHRATEFISALQKSRNERPQNADQVNQLLRQAQPYLDITDNGVITHTSQLSAAAATIQKALYAIPPSRGIEDYELRIKPHYEFINATVWQAVLGTNFQEAVRWHLQKQGIHSHSPEVLERESKYFVSAVANGDTARFSSFLAWCLEEDPKVVDKLLRKLG